ncbi:uncharacterized protein MHO_3780-like [Onthophagus taurus]|uniref:uncharacterized protein MHO_3780-like n=1 Tax=Onthophagus taurus TaxID=166361 RepID=UPI0039BE2AA4
MFDKEFFEKLLNLKVSNLKIENACEIGENFVSKVERIFIYGIKNDIDFQTSLILKTFSTNPATQSHNFDKQFQNESIFYKTILNLLNKYSRSTLKTPKCFYNNEKHLIFEDLTLDGFKTKPKGHRFDLNEAKLVIKEISKMHSASLSLQIKDSKSFLEVLSNLHSFMNKEGNQLLEKCYLDHLNTSIKIFEENSEIVTFLKSLKENVYSKVIEIFEKPTEIKVLNHGDLWGNNIFFKNDVDIKIIDFQMLHYGSPAMDLVYFLWINLDSENRKTNFKELLECYIENLKRFSFENDIDSNLINKMTLQWIQNEMKTFTLYGMLCCFIFLPVFYINLDDISRNYHLDNVYMKLMNDSYKENMINAVRDFIHFQNYNF